MSVEETIVGGGAGGDGGAGGGDGGQQQQGGAGGQGGGAGGGDGGQAGSAGGGDQQQQQQQGPWGNDWREKLANGDAKKLERLGRFASPEALWAAQEEAQRKISEGLKPKAKPGEKATDADWQAYRKEMGIPEAVEDYVKAIPMPDGRQIGEDDKPVLDYFSQKAIARGVSPADMGVLVDAYYAMQEEQVANVEKADSEFKRAGVAALKQEFGGDYDANIAAMRPYFDSVNPDLFDNLFGGRMADGSKVGDHPDIIRFFVAKAVAENPLATIVPSGGGGAQALDNEIAALEKRMGEDRDGWFKDEKAQARYRQLVEARDKLAARK